MPHSVAWRQTHVVAYDTEFTGNKAKVGGAFASAGIAITTLVRPKLASNSATALGGSLYAAGRSTVNFTKGTTKFSACALGETAVGYGGVFYAASFASFSVMDSTFYDQSVNGFGGVSATIGNAYVRPTALWCSFQLSHDRSPPQQDIVQQMLVQCIMGP